MMDEVERKMKIEINVLRFPRAPKSKYTRSEKGKEYNNEYKGFP